MKKKISLFVAVIFTAISFYSFNANALNISRQYIHQNRSYQFLQPRGLIIHDTDAPGGTAQNNHDYFNRVHVGASAHYFCGWNKVIQTIPESECAWHAGYTANHRFLSIEMCVPKAGNYTEFNKVYQNTVDLAASICKKYGWSTNQIYSHRYCSWTWHQTDHEDPYAFLKQFGKSWNDLMGDIQARINGGSITTYSNSISNVSNSYSNSNYNGSDTNATIKVGTSLNVRNCPNGNIIGSLNNGERVKINYACSVGNWYSIYFGNHGGFVSKDYVKLDNLNEPKHTALHGRVTSKIGLNVRNTNDEIIGVLENGASVIIDTEYSNSSQWSIRYGNHGGLVSKKYIKLN